MKRCDLLKGALLGTVCSLLACSGFLDRGGPGISPENIEHISVKEQALAEISETPLEFAVAFDRNVEAWQRAVTFFSLYANRGSTGNFVEKENEISSVAGPASSYDYVVKRAFTQSGVNYTVNCRAAGNQASSFIAERNARNLARFIRDGTLELSLLE